MHRRTQCEVHSVGVAEQFSVQGCDSVCTTGTASVQLARTHLSAQAEKFDVPFSAVTQRRTHGNEHRAGLAVQFSISLADILAYNASQDSAVLSACMQFVGVLSLELVEFAEGVKRHL